MSSFGGLRAESFEAGVQRFESGVCIEFRQCDLKQVPIVGCYHNSHSLGSLK